jgi:hypothetical protein
MHGAGTPEPRLRPDPPVDPPRGRRIGSPDVPSPAGGRHAQLTSAPVTAARLIGPLRILGVDRSAFFSGTDPRRC